jgi:hypothetical protein
LNDRQLSIQLGKYNVNIGEGKEIHIGDRIYQQWDKEAMEALVKTFKKLAVFIKILRVGMPQEEILINGMFTKIAYFFN